MADSIFSSSSGVNLRVAEFFCAELLTTWNSVSSAFRPPHVWLRQHEPFEYQPDVHRIPTPVIGAWFLEEGHIEKRSIFEFLRFYVVQGDRVWSSMKIPPPSHIFGGRGRHEFALSAFAQILGTEDYYFEWQFGGLHGRATRYQYKAGIFEPKETLWIS